MYNETLSSIINRSKAYLYSIDCKESTVERSYGYIWKRMLIDLGDISDFNDKRISEHCINYYGKDFSKMESFLLTNHEMGIIKKLVALLNFKKNGTIPYLNSEKRKLIVADTASMDALLQYNAYQESIGLKQTTITGKSDSIKRFLRTYPITNLSEDGILAYIKNLNTHNPYSSRLEMNIVKKFLIYAQSIGCIDNDFKYLFPTHVVSSTTSISSFYEPHEIDIVINYYNINPSVCCKRNYAIMLILAVYGLRARDITLLSIDNINFNTSTISLLTSKTSVKVSFPLYPIVSNSLIDYILNERPKSNSDKVFLLKDGNDITGSAIITSIVNKAFKSSEIDIRNKHFGPHSLRSSLATRMLNESTPIYTISKVLGHASIDTTKIYTKVDIPNLRLCALEVTFNGI